MIIFFKKLRKLPSDLGSSVAKGGYSPLPPIDLLTKVQKKKIPPILALRRLFFCPGMDKRWFKAFFWNIYSGGGGEFVKNENHKSMKTLKNA